MGKEKKSVKKVNSRDTAPLISIACITYNHEKYIRRCIEGFLNQKTSFEIEIIIHDDASTDNTANIVKEYADKYPNLILTILQTENKFSEGIKIWPTFVYPRARGKYIAFCEGDDYWTDPLKLQKQVDFLESNPDYSLTSHEAYYTYINDPNSLRKFASILYDNYKLDGISSLIELVKLLITDNKEFWSRRRKSSRFERHPEADFEVALETASSNRYIPTLSIVARSKYLKSIPSELFKLTAGHRLIILWTALHGKQKHFNDVMGFKNTQESSVTVTKVLKTINTKPDKLRNLKVYEILKKHASEDQSKLIEGKINKILEKDSVN